VTIALSQLNFRDLGGLPVTGGRRIRSGVLYRCQGPGSFNDDHRQELGALGIRTVCDLRSTKERQQASHAWDAPTLVINLDLPNEFDGPSSFVVQALRENPTLTAAMSALCATYGRMPGAIHPHLARIVNTIGTGNLPAMIHCTAGKDRTGVLVALLLLFIGVPHDVVIQDYLRSEAYVRYLRGTAASMRPAFEAFFGFAAEDGVAEAVGGVHADFLQAALDLVDTEWGSVDGYFASAGIDGRRQAELRALLTEG
jgi:protein-tyrosine phosphatase